MISPPVWAYCPLDPTGIAVPNMHKRGMRIGTEAAYKQKARFPKQKAENASSTESRKHSLLNSGGPRPLQPWRPPPGGRQPRHAAQAMRSVGRGTGCADIAPMPQREMSPSPGFKYDAQTSVAAYIKNCI